MVYFALQDAEEVKAKVGEIDEWRVLGEVNTVCVAPWIYSTVYGKRVDENNYCPLSLSFSFSFRKKVCQSGSAAPEQNKLWFSTLKTRFDLQV